MAGYSSLDELVAGEDERRARARLDAEDMRASAEAIEPDPAPEVDRLAALEARVARIEHRLGP